MAEKNNTFSFVLIAIVAIVAIVALIVGINNNSYTSTTKDSGDLVGEASKQLVERVDGEIPTTSWIDDDGTHHKISGSVGGITCHLTAQCPNFACNLAMSGCEETENGCSGSSCTCTQNDGGMCGGCYPVCIGGKDSSAIER